MAKILVLGGGVAGLSTGMLLARDGHDVTVLERDPAAPPGSAEEVWEQWDRKGVNQFRMLHFFQPRFRQIVETELPEVAAEADAAGALRVNPVADAPAEMTGGSRPGDEVYQALTARRPVMEMAMAKAAAATSGLNVVRGAAVAGLVSDGESAPGVPRVVGVKTDDGNEL